VPCVVTTGTLRTPCKILFAAILLLFYSATNTPLQWRIQGGNPAMPPQFGHGVHCGQLILMKISKIGATKCQILRLKMHQIRFLLGLRPRPRRGAYSAPPDSVTVFKGPTSKRREGEGKERKGSGEKEKRKDEGGERRGGLPPIRESGSASGSASAPLVVCGQLKAAPPLQPYCACCGSLNTATKKGEEKRKHGLQAWIAFLVASAFTIAVICHCRKSMSRGGSRKVWGGGGTAPSAHSSPTSPFHPFSI